MRSTRRAWVRVRVRFTATLIGVVASCAASHSTSAQPLRPGTAPATMPATAPTTAPVPATAPAAGPVVALTPKDALRQLNIALRDGNAAAIRSLFLTADDEAKKLVGAMADYAEALAALHRAAIQAYGPEGGNTVTGDMDAQSADAMAAIDRAEASVDGATALVKYADATDAPVRLVKVDGSWRLPLAQMLGGVDHAAQERRLTELRSQTQLARETTREIAAGKYKLADKAAEVWRSRLLEAVAPHATTRPAQQGEEK